MPNGTNADTRPATLGDINRIYLVLNPLQETLARMNQKLDDMILPAQPCRDHTNLEQVVKAHIQKHDDAVSDWRKAAINGIVRILAMLIIAGVAYYTGTNKGDSQCQPTATNVQNAAGTQK